jgi:hypothetical protein
MKRKSPFCTAELERNPVLLDCEWCVGRLSRFFELTGCGSSANPSAVSFIQNLMPQLPFYENDYRYRSVLGRRAACGADPALLGITATTTGTRFERPRQISGILENPGLVIQSRPSSAKRCTRLGKTSSHQMFENILRADQLNVSGGSAVVTTKLDLSGRAKNYIRRLGE